MVITDEFKFPRPLDWSKFTDARQVREVYGVSAVLPIKHIKRRWQRTHEERPTKEEENQVGLALDQLINQVNHNLEAHGVDIHIVLQRKEDGYGLDIYDCTGEDACRIMQAKSVDLADLPVLLKNLQEGAGLLVDSEV